LETVGDRGRIVAVKRSESGWFAVGSTGAYEVAVVRLLVVCVVFMVEKTAALLNRGGYFFL
jgi:hypothetical protein